MCFCYKTIFTKEEVIINGRRSRCITRISVLGQMDVAGEALTDVWMGKTKNYK